MVSTMMISAPHPSPCNTHTHSLFLSLSLSAQPSFNRCTLSTYSVPGPAPWTELGGRLDIILPNKHPFRGRETKHRAISQDCTAELEFNPVSLLPGPLLLCHTLLLPPPNLPTDSLFCPESELSSIHAWTMAVALGASASLNQEVPHA